MGVHQRELHQIGHLPRGLVPLDGTGIKRFCSKAVGGQDCSKAPKQDSSAWRSRSQLFKRSDAWKRRRTILGRGVVCSTPDVFWSSSDVTNIDHSWQWDTNKQIPLKLFQSKSSADPADSAPVHQALARVCCCELGRSQTPAHRASLTPPGVRHLQHGLQAARVNTSGDVLHIFSSLGFSWSHIYLVLS